MIPCEFNEGDLTFSKCPQPVVESMFWTDDDYANWSQVLQNWYRTYDDSTEIKHLLIGTACIICQLVFVENRWMAYVISPHGAGWVRAKELQK